MGGRTVSRRGLAVGLAAVVVIVGAVVAAVVVFGGSGQDGVPVPAAKPTSTGQPDDQPPPPDGEVAGRTLSYLDKDGAAIMVMHRAAQDLAKGYTLEKCDQVATTLDRDAPPDQMLIGIAGIPDEPLREAFEAERLSLAATLTACAKGSTTVPATEDILPLPEITAIVQARLDSVRAVR